MKHVGRLILILIAVLVVAAFCGTRLHAAERAKPRSNGGQNSGQARPRDSQPSHAHPRQQAPPRVQPPAHREPQHAQPRQNDGQPRNDAEHRQPRPGYRDNRGERRGDSNTGRHNYDWRNYGQRQRWDRDRFPRSYHGSGLFDRRYYRGHRFGPHYRLWYYDRFTWTMFYWPYAYEPLYGCGWYWVPTERRPIDDPYSDEEFWDYTDYQYRYICFN